MNSFYNYGKSLIILLFILLNVNLHTQMGVDIDIYVNQCREEGEHNGTSWEDAYQDFTFDINEVSENENDIITIHVSPGIYSTSKPVLGKLVTLYVDRSNVKIIKDISPIDPCSQEEVIFDGQGIIDFGIFVYKNNVPNFNGFQIEDIKIRNYKENGIIVQRMDNSLIRKCIVEEIIGLDNDDDNCAAIQIKNSTTVTVENCTIIGTNSQNKPAQLDGIYTQHSNNITIQNNEIILTNNYDGSLGGDPHIDQIQFYSCSGPINIENNFIKYLGTFEGFGTGGGQQGIYFTNTSGEINVKNNRVISAVGSNIHIYLEEETSNINVYNNTLVLKNNPVVQNQHSLIEFNNNSSSTDILNVKNNILYKDGYTGDDRTAIKFVRIEAEDLQFRNYFNNNLYFNTSLTPSFYFDPDGVSGSSDEYSRDWNFSGPPDEFGRWWETNGREGNPLFIDNEYRLDHKSPAKNLGIAFADLTTDFDGNNRPYWSNDYDAGAYEIEDTQLKFTSNVGQQTTHSLTSVGTYWERNSSGVTGVFNISTDQSLGSATCVTPQNAPNDDEIWKFPGVEYKWMDWSNNSSGSRIAAGLYKISNNSNNAYFYLDLRDAIESYNINVYLKLIGGQSPKYQYRQNGTFDNHDIANGSVKRIWDINSGQPNTNGLPEYWANCLVPLAMDNYPFIVWGPYPSSYSMELHNYQISRKLDVLDWDVLTTANSSTFQYKDESYNLGNSFPAYYKVRKVEGIVSEYSEYTNTVIINVHGSQVGKYSLETEVFNFVLEQNYPNPFNPLTTITFSIPEEELVIIKLYDILGKEVKVLVSSIMNAGRYNVTVDLSSLSSGIYFYSINAGEYSSIKKMQLLK